jgi:hypothetical protein
MLSKLIQIKTRDNFIWNESDLWIKIYQALQTYKNVELDFLREGPDLDSLGFYKKISDLAKESNYDLKNIKIKTSNVLETHPEIIIDKQIPMQGLINLFQTINDVIKNPVIKEQDLLPFGIFIGRSNALRLLILSYIFANYSDKSKLTFHYNLADDWHRGELGLDNIFNDYKISDITDVAKLLSYCPIGLDGIDYHDLNKNIDNQGHDRRLLGRDQTSFINAYKKIFVEIVCESFFTGNTFFPTEKTWRPMLLKTPFVIQGPQNYLLNLKKLGFKTFDQWWDEGYSQDPSDYQIHGIKQVIDYLAKLSKDEINRLYKEMTPVLEHNQRLATTLSTKEWNCFNVA